jgi:hypothetical protein
MILDEKTKDPNALALNLRGFAVGNGILSYKHQINSAVHLVCFITIFIIFN